LLPLVLVLLLLLLLVPVLAMLLGSSSVTASSLPFRLYRVIRSGCEALATAGRAPEAELVVAVACAGGGGGWKVTGGWVFVSFFNQGEIEQSQSYRF
jgi:hypothetical protein